MITRVTIKNYRGIEALDVEPGPNGSVARGRCSSGKTSFLKAVRAALSAQDIGPDAIRHGADEAEILVDVDDVSVRRRISPKSSTLTVTKDKFKAPKAQTYLTELLGSSPLDPMDLLTLKQKERRQKILAALPITVTVEQLRKWWPKCPDNFDVSGHGLEIVEGLRAKCYEQRTAKNKIAKEHRTEANRLAEVAAEAAKNAPSSVSDVVSAIARHDAARANLVALRARQEESERAESRVKSSRERVAELRAYVASVQGKQERVSVEELARQETALLAAKELVSDLEERLREARNNLELCQDEIRNTQEKNALANKHEASAADAERQAKDIEAAISLATVAPVTTEEMAAATESVKKAESEAKSATEAQALSRAATAAKVSAQTAEDLAKESEAEADRLDRMVKAFTDDAPRELLTSSDGIPGLTLDGDDVRLDGVSLDSLCGREQIRFVVQVARRANAKTKILVVDGLERLDPDSYREFVREATAGGWQLLASRVDAGEMVIDAISSDDSISEAAE